MERYGFLSNRRILVGKKKIKMKRGLLLEVFLRKKYFLNLIQFKGEKL